MIPNYSLSTVNTQNNKKKNKYINDNKTPITKQNLHSNHHLPTTARIGYEGKGGK